MAKRVKGSKQRGALKAPQRMCIACRASDGKRDLIRLVRVADGVLLDQSGKMAGRGAYVHPQVNCWEKALAGSLIQKALRTKISAENLMTLSDSVSTLLQLSDETA
ncbi:MAG: YlxR family protein [Caldilineaceae bacterium SB0661_bin_32]|uniref:YlxR family protein n=1 Tax=Caldilineaceae bacterium SB0661_bin_32 TaxID=2605255 RepID=A0A6B1DCZ2_9CHLR|nr:YlxR family protein [Caldilineaceae bacterium SB0661_bin_32]